MPPFPWVACWDEPAGRTSLTADPDGYARLAAVHRRPPDRIVLYGKPPFPPYGPGVYREAPAPPADAAAFDGLAAACEEVAEWLGRRSVHYQELGSHDVAADLLNRAERLRAALALAAR